MKYMHLIYTFNTENIMPFVFDKSLPSLNWLTYFASHLAMNLASGINTRNNAVRRKQSVNMWPNGFAPL